MLDTITACTKEFNVLSLSGFGEEMRSKDGSVSRHVFYKNLPHCRLEIDHINGELGIRASLPHLVYGASLFEMAESDVGRTVGKLQSIAKEAGVSITESALSQSRIYRIDICKNVQVSHSCKDYVALLDNFRMPKSDKVNYKLETLTFGAKSRNKQICIYNKIRQVSQVRDKEERALAVGKPENILRFESRLLNNKTIKKEIKSPLFLFSAFNKQMAREQIMRDFNRIKDVQETQMSLNFDVEVELYRSLKEMFGKRAFEAFLGVKGSAQAILQSFRYEYSAVLELFKGAGLSDSTAYKNTDKLFRYNSIKPAAENRCLIEELREKLAA